MLRRAIWTGPFELDESLRQLAQTDKDLVDLVL